MKKYDLINKSERIFNIDETGFSPEHTPHKVVGPKDIPLQSVCSARSFTTTLSACASGTGVVVLILHLKEKGKLQNLLMVAYLAVLVQ